MKRILIVDDAATVRLFHRAILEEAGYLVEEAVNGIEALEKALQQPFDLYVVDINMPKMDGFGFLQELRAQGGAQAPAIMVSFDVEAEEKLRAFSSGANVYLTKPVAPELLQLNVGLLLGEART